MQLFSVVLLFAVWSQAVQSAEWTYKKGAHGPANWAGECQNGTEQSPINLNPLIARAACDWEDLEFIDYDREITKYKLKNNGHTIQLEGIETADFTPKIKGGNLPDTYRFHQFHFHWGQKNSRGSEHTVMGHSYPLELHLVHLREGSEDPLSERTGAAVIGVMFYIDNSDQMKNTTVHKWLNDFTAKAKQVNKKDDRLSENTPFRMFDLLPKNRQTFYRYMGSLTTPGCYEAVVWTNLVEPLPITTEQLKVFRDMLNSEDEKYFNYRPVQPLNERELFLRNNDGAACEWFHKAKHAPHATSASWTALVLGLLAVKLFA